MHELLSRHDDWQMSFLEVHAGHSARLTMVRACETGTIVSLRFALTRNIHLVHLSDQRDWRPHYFIESIVIMLAQRMTNLGSTVQEVFPELLNSLGPVV